MSLLDGVIDASRLLNSIYTNGQIMSLESKNQISTLIDKHLNQIFTYKRYANDAGLKKILELEATATSTLQKYKEKQFYTKNKLKLFELIKIRNNINLELTLSISLIENHILSISKELNQISQEIIFLYNKESYKENEIQNLQHLLSRDISANQANILKNLNHFISEFEKQIIKALIYLYPKISTDFLHNELGIITQGHFDIISCIQISKNNDFFISGSYDGTIRLWNLQTRSQDYIFNGHKGPINTLALTKDGKFAISGSDDGTIIIWNIEKRSLVKYIKKLLAPIKKIELTYDDKYFASLSINSALVWWDLYSFGNNDTIIISREASDFTLFYDKYFIIYWEETRLLCKDILSSNDKYVFNIDNFDRLYSFKISKSSQFILFAYNKTIMRLCKNNKKWGCTYIFYHTSEISDLAIASNDEFIITVSDNCLKVLCLLTYQCLKTMKSHNSLLKGIALSKDNNLAITLSNFNTITIWNITLGILEASLPCSEKIFPNLYLTDTAKYMILGCTNGSIIICDIVEKALKIIKNHTKEVRCICLSLDTSLVVTGSDDCSVIVWRIKTRETVTFYNEHSSVINCLDLRKDNKIVVSGSDDHMIIVWDVEKNSLYAKFEGHTGPVKCIIIFHKRHYLASGSTDKNAILWNLLDKRKYFTIKGHTSTVNKLDLTKNYLVSGSNYEIIIWNLIEKATKYKISLFSISKIVASNKSRTLFAMETSKKDLLIWSSQYNKQMAMLKKYPISKCAVLTENMKLIIPTQKNFNMLIYNILTNKKISLLKGHKSKINAMVLTDDEYKLVTGSSDKSINVWNLDLNILEFTLVGHYYNVCAIFLTKDKKLIVSGSIDYTVRVWSIDKRVLVDENLFDSSVLCLSMTSDNRYLFLGLNSCAFKMYDSKSKTVKLLTNFDFPVEKVEITNNDKYCISISAGLHLKIWNIEKDKIEIVYSSKEMMLNSFVISTDSLYVYVPSVLSGLAMLNLRNIFKKNVDEDDQKDRKNSLEIEVTEDILENFVRIYDVGAVREVAQENEIAGFISSYIF